MHIVKPETETFSRIFTPQGPADRELEWFFTMADSDIRGASAFVTGLALVGDTPRERSIEERAESAHAQRKMLEWFEEIGDYDAGVLKAAYTARPWPLKLREELGRLTGVVVRMAAAELGLPDDDRDLDRLEQRTAARLDEVLAKGAPVVGKLQLRASPVLRQAFNAYVRERGGRERPVMRGVS